MTTWTETHIDTDTVRLPLDAIRPSPLNPAMRMEEGRLITLRESIREKGVLIPIAINEHGEIIDGHRRYRCAQELGLGDIRVNVIPGAEGEDFFLELAETTRNLTYVEWTERYLQGGSVPSKVHQLVSRLERAGGKALLKKLVDRRISPSIIKVTSQIQTYMNVEKRDDAMALQIVEWLLATGNRNFQARTALADGIDPAVLLEAIEHRQDLRPVWTVMPRNSRAPETAPRNRPRAGQV